MGHDAKSPSKWERIILHADMDAFFAAVEQLDNPEYRGKPVVVGGTSDRGVVSTANYEARVFGVGSAMPMAEARRLCPDAVVLSPRVDRYAELSRCVMKVFSDMSPLVEPLSLDEAFLDMTGAERLFGPPREMAIALKKRVFEVTGGLTVSVGGATTKFVAKVASDHEKPDGITIVESHSTLDFLWPLSVKRLWGVGPKAAKILIDLNIETIGDVAAADEGLLVRHLGTLGAHVAKLSRGEDPREVKPTRTRKSVGAERTLEKNILGRMAIEKQVRKLAKKVGATLRKKGLAARGVRVKLKTAGFDLRTRQTSLHVATNSAAHLEREANRLLKRLDLTEPMRLVGLSTFDLEGDEAGDQGELFIDPDVKKARDIDRTVDALNRRFGESSLFTPDDDGEEA